MWRIPTLLAAAALTLAPAPKITVLDSTFYSNVSLGATRVNVVYDPTDQNDDTKIPTLAQMRTAVDAHGTDTSQIVVLDFEKFYLQGDSATEQRHLTSMRQVINLLKQIRPGERYGMYGVSDHYDSKYLADVQSLEAGSYAYFPTNYTSTSDTAAAWTATTTTKAASARRVGAKPVYLFVWPEYRQGGFLPAWDSETTSAHPSFNHELSTVESQGLAGVVVWSMAKSASNTEWTNVVHDYLTGVL
ncbi:hypothetical protein [Kutzneria sp. CA-103260]|uniref:hypothetical protein n=1 Tax=Kutzneria sp. CA-103260 TaxID=2802641 RepID=UPI001BA85271|nr:hypothetical protein [Kutzneria sp. CA-103260]QUQ65598.1 hypothetical protein JJ691_33220 [Kutzneria sp. CA-103260]